MENNNITITNMPADVGLRLLLSLHKYGYNYSSDSRLNVASLVPVKYRGLGNSNALVGNNVIYLYNTYYDETDGFDKIGTPFSETGVFDLGLLIWSSTLNKNLHFNVSDIQFNSGRAVVDYTALGLSQPGRIN